MTLRAFNLQDDLDVMISLIKAAFHYPENEGWNLSTDEITSIVDDFSLMRRLQPLFKVAGLFNPAFNAMMQGYIWEEEGQAIGLVNLSPMGLDQHTWVIGNVAVRPEHRRKGIARQLIQATIDLAYQQQARTVVLEVIADNVPAVKLYEAKGFEIYSTTAQLSRDAALEVPPLQILPQGYRIEPYHVSDWEARYRLMTRIIPSAVQQYAPIKRTTFYKSPPMRLLRSVIMALSPINVASHLVRHQVTNTVVAYIAAHQRKKAGGINEIEIDLDPEHALLAPYLVNVCVRETLNDAVRRDIQLRIPTWQSAVLQAAHEAGFVTRAEWSMMGMHLSQSPQQSLSTAFSQPDSP